MLSWPDGKWTVFEPTFPILICFYLNMKKRWSSHRSRPEQGRLLAEGLEIEGGDNSARETPSHHQAVIFSRTKKAPDLLFLSLLFLEASPWRSPGFTVVWSFSLGRTGQLGRKKGKEELHRWAFLVPLQRRNCNHASVSYKWPLLLKFGRDWGNPP